MKYFALCNYARTVTGIKLTFEYELETTKVIRYVVTFRNNNNMLTLNNNFLIKIWVSNFLMGILQRMQLSKNCRVRKRNQSF